jgi:hypothetical protein
MPPNPSGRPHGGSHSTARIRGYFKLPWEERKGIQVTPNFEREIGLSAYRAWQNKQDRHPY